MAVLIGHASISEKASINGKKGDQTGREVCTRAWYSKPWDYMAIHPDAAVREKHARAVEAACANGNIGYGQADRNTANTEAKKVGYDISKIKTKCNTDCSALQNLAAVAAGTPGVTYGANGWTTSTMLAALKAAGYKIITDSTYLKSADFCVRGAIYVKSGSHTVCGLTNGGNYKKTLEKAGLAASQAERTYTVQKGDTLSGIASRHGTTYQRLADYNGIANPGKISVGQVIRIPGGGTRTYTVKAGDSLWAIAAAQMGNGSRYKEIKALNGLASDTVRAGQVLKIPV